MDIEQSTALQAAHAAHYVQFYKADEPRLNRNVGNFLWEGLLRGDGLLVVATPQRRESLANQLTRLGAEVSTARREGQLVTLDAAQMLERILVKEEPTWETFQAVIAEAVCMVQPRGPDGQIRIYGEMVGLLWEKHWTAAAERLEEYWNRMLHGTAYKLFCGYPIDIFAEEFQDDAVHNILCAHSGLAPADTNSTLDEALRKAMDEVLGARAEEVRLKINGQSRSMREASAEITILWLRSRYPAEAENILSAAREYYTAAAGAANSAAL
jgi:hypothetical protein